MVAQRLFTFAGGDDGPWRVLSSVGVRGDAMPPVERLAVSPPGTTGTGSAWSLSGMTSNERYVERDEKAALVARQEAPGRPGSTLAALIPLRKSAAWWALTQDERRAIFEVQSHHIAIGLRYLPAIARRLHHCRDLGADQPFDFLTWFEYAPSDAAAFDELLVALRASPEWAWVEREADLRLVRDGTAT